MRLNYANILKKKWRYKRVLHGQVEIVRQHKNHCLYEKVHENNVLRVSRFHQQLLLTHQFEERALLPHKTDGKYGKPAQQKQDATEYSLLSPALLSHFY